MSASLTQLDATDSKSDEERPSSRLSDSGIGRPGSFIEQRDVEKFAGKILYKSGSAYIIDDAELNDGDELPIPRPDSDEGIHSSHDASMTAISNAFYISKSSAYFNSLYGQSGVKLMQEKNVLETPVVHSFKVFTPRDQRGSQSGSMEETTDLKNLSPLMNYSAVPVKPILMCFMCKLSFACTESFVNHCAEGGHNIILNADEKQMLEAKNCSAIIQNAGKEKKEATVSFLEPLITSREKSPLSQPPLSPGAINSSNTSPKTRALLTSSKVPNTSSPSASSADPASMAAMLLSASSVGALSSPPPPASSSSLSSSKTPPGSASKLSPIGMAEPFSPLGGQMSSRSPPMAPNTPESRLSEAPSPMASSPLPAVTTTISSYPNLPTNANMLQGTTIGACPEHVNGRPTGVECSQCDLILNQSRLSGMGWNTARNSCKTLKCPKCNWHYKYQETLEIHMKEKHPENETTCIYCITGQQHPRLARGETYTCGYKPYRCEVCNYSTTTKGNLSIHMQSDKHLNNMQELQNNGASTASTMGTDGTNKISSSPSNVRPGSGSSNSTPLASPKQSAQQHQQQHQQQQQQQPQKPNFRCDVCNYETNVARNLRIHMTSEKHTHNMMSIQHQNVSQSIQQQLSASGMGVPGYPSMAGLMSGMQGSLDPKQLLQFSGLLAASGSGGNKAEPAAVMADFAYNQALLAQLMSGGQFPGAPPPDFANMMAGNNGLGFPGIGAPSLKDNDSQSDMIEPNPKHLFTCCVCRNFSCDQLDDISSHLSEDRSRTRESEVSIVIAGNYLCQLCNYKTTLKANFQLHCKTDKHLQRLSHVNHIKEGGPSNEWKLRCLSNMNPVELRCNACDFVTNSPHKLQVHVSNQEHQVSSVLFIHLQNKEHEAGNNQDAVLSFNCVLCDFQSSGKHGLMQHVRTMRHLQMEQVHQLKKRALRNTSQTEIEDIFQVADLANKHSPEENKREQRGLESSGMVGNDGGEDDIAEDEQEIKSNLGSKEAAYNYNLDKYMDPNRPFKCEVCKESFTQKNILLVHYNSVNHLNRLKKSITQAHHENNSNSGESEREPNNTEHKRKQSQSSMSNQRQRLASSEGGDAADLSFSVPVSSPRAEKTPPRGSALEALFGGRRDDDEVKPFKCNICRVAYSQDSTLDIHVRSVLHQTKAAKLQDLILSGQIDLSKPLIERPDAQQIQEQHKKMVNDLLSPKSVNSTGSTNCNSSPNLRVSSPNRSGSPQSSPLANLHALMTAKNNGSPNESSSDESSSMITNLAKTFLPGLVQQSQDEKDDKRPSPVLKNLLQHYGLDFVKQFSDFQGKPEEDKDDVERGRGTPNSERSQSRPPSVAPQSQGGNLTEVQEALQKAMIQSQLQHMNPMLMQMSQMNPLLAMNLTPPLLPPSMMKAGGGLQDLQAALLSQMHQNTQHLLGQQVGNQNPFLPMGLDPKLLALISSNKQPTDLSSDSSSNLPQMVGRSPSSGNTKESPISNFGKPPPTSLPDPKTLLMQQQPVPVDQGKRARTRITDEQLKILRSNFDINNSPSEDMLNLMAQQTGLPLKVIKHWFRNTLFKERQKNKDSPYNFNNPPSTKLNLEEYEKTGEPKVTPLNLEDQAAYVRESVTKKEDIKTEPLGHDESEDMKPCPSSPGNNTLVRPSSNSDHSAEDSNATTTNKVPNINIESSSNFASTVTPTTVSGNSLTLSKLLSSQMGQLAPTNNLLPNFPAFPNTTNSPMPPTSMPDYLNSFASRLGQGGPSEMTSPRAQSPQSIPSSTGKRANRTRFTDYQIKVLQEFFENNAYPKDDDLEYLSKLLGLSPRVIVVWFQNARQKARKIYENQPASEGNNGGTNTPAPPNNNSNQSSDEGDNTRFNKKEGCNYQCKKCMLIFQRYYELIRHQKQHCYKEEDAKRSAQAQKAAAQAAAQFGGTNGSNFIQPPASEDSNSSLDHRSIASPFPHSNEVTNNAKGGNGSAEDPRRDHQQFSDLTKDAVNRMFTSGGSFLNYAPNSPFGILQHQALQQQCQQQSQHPANPVPSDNAMDGDEMDNESIESAPSSTKRKLSEEGDLGDESAHKRLRTSILPEQLDFLYQKYQLENNPSRKMLERIASEVGLRKRVVQVWFQNTRARDRKGQLKPPMPNQPMSIAVSNSDEDEDKDRPSLPESPFLVSDQIASLIPNSTSAYNLQNSMRKYYEDTMKRFMNDINDANVRSGLAAAAAAAPLAAVQLESSPASMQQALDLTSNFDDSSDHQEDFDPNKSCDTDSNHGGGSKRFRTQMSSVQVKMMKGIFEAYKTPTMTECSNLGQEIGLQKRVVQVWFQNARAKEKRAKMQLQQATGQDTDGNSVPTPEECKVCGIKYEQKFAVQDHLFTKDHLMRLRVAIENGKYDPESPGHNISQSAALIQGGQRTPSSDSANQSLQMLQMTTQVNNRELLDKIASHQNNPRMLMQV
ncbi:hypothetical protein TCAL_11806 [Tigriopus californicus]|uniref:Zinc finger homeobox protein 4 n=1 Tax=Tigriopus californicus TaxID=6832 RepID=A0A553N9I1_TIGCA|nr:zinc finger protein 2-like [Tigriopus californicus]TRY62059.1 hypothetical protein TCAL_11806 [Tigriopus californicus]|eukprot:TCALIF_11806-PA protein Name:"Similar to ZFHX3 Zinc finger homeobox protein 3 (Homo sapiens)" AED:0.00 eAED:0.00 QI:98/1/1/1/1/1/2/778/2430